MSNKRVSDFTEEEKTRIIAKARETSFRKAAEEFEVNRNVTKHWVPQRKPATDRKSSDDFTKKTRN